MRSREETVRFIDDYFHNRIPAERVEEAIHMLGSEKCDADIDQIMKKHWGSSSAGAMLKDQKFDALLGQIHHRINLSKGKGSRFFTKLTKVAAVLFIPLMVSFVTYLSIQFAEKSKEPLFNEVYSPMAARTRFLLPDGTVVWLNSGTVLKYPSAFSGKTREVFLEGEAYFDVKTNPKIPFVVKTDHISVKAYGTSFDILAYPDLQEVSVILVSGKVMVSRSESEKGFYLDPSSMAILEVPEGPIKVSSVDTRLYTSWKDGVLIFSNEPLEMVTNKLERWYNCTIHIEDDELKDYRYTGNIKMETLREVLDLIAITAPIGCHYNQDTREVWLEMK